MLFFCDIPCNVRSDVLIQINIFFSLGGLIDVNMSEISFDEIQQLFSKDLDIKPGGHWKPKDCKPRWKVRCCWVIFVIFFFFSLFLLVYKNSLPWQALSLLLLCILNNMLYTYHAICAQETKT